MADEFRFTAGNGHLSLHEISIDGRAFGDPVPEPASMTLLGIGLVGVVARSRRKRKQA